MYLLKNMELGLFNGWIYSLILLLVSHSGFIFAKRMPSFPSMTKTAIILSIAVSVFSYGVPIFTIWLPISSQGGYFWAGNVIFIIGIIIISMSIAAFNKTPDNKPVTTGIYKITRNPMYLGTFFSSIAIGCCESPHVNI